MDSKVILVAGAVMTGWLMLSLLSSERKRRVTEWEARKPLKTKAIHEVGKAEMKK